VCTLNKRAASYVRLLIEQSVFIPCTRAVTAAVRACAGYIACAQFSSLVPSERFYLGGSSTVRAYQQDMLAPLVSCDHAGCRFWVPTGSRVVVSTSAELRAVLASMLGIVLFQDVGFLRDERNGVWCFGGATGIGARCITPIGPLRFDIGFKNKNMLNDRMPFAWFLTIGQAF
jgi:outer membrane protein assembly factor BamA